MSLRRKPTTEPNLRRRWRVALAHAGLTESEWARERGVTPAHVRHLTTGSRESTVLRPEILAFIRSRERILMEELQAWKHEDRLMAAAV